MLPDFKGEFHRAPFATTAALVAIAWAIWSLMRESGWIASSSPSGQLPLAYVAAVAVGAGGGLISLLLIRVRLWLGVSVSLVFLFLTARILRPIINQFEIRPGSIDFWLIGSLAFAVFVGILAEAAWARYRDEPSAIVFGLFMVTVVTLVGFLNTFGMTG